MRYINVRFTNLQLRVMKLR